MKIRKPTPPKNTDPTQSKIISILAKNIKYYRNKQLISQEYLAELCELHRNYIGQVERAECNISIMNLEAIARALKVNLIDLLQK
ncbi:MAG: helix-turn-helix domain-containing protein [Amoebophilaceae bacterium]|nr:helix-turn-helix domain-containing protein [Amoebophilaceae bacterium]MBY0244593.1 helix-turn-helix domain-containing protein [Sphingobacteriaceae bacterium]